MKPDKPKKKVTLPPAWIVGDAAISIPNISQGRTLPLLIVDATSVPLLKEVIRSHKYLPSGDVTTDWGIGAEDSSIIGLKVHFQRPIDAACMIVFQMPQHAILVEQVLLARGLYLQTGKEGDRLKTTFDSSRILIDVPLHQKFAALWEREFPKITARQLRKEKGLSRAQAREIAPQAIAEYRKTLGNFRLPTWE